MPRARRLMLQVAYQLQSPCTFENEMYRQRVQPRHRSSQDFSAAWYLLVRAFLWVARQLPRTSRVQLQL